MSGKRLSKLLIFSLLAGFGWASVLAQDKPPARQPPNQTQAKQAISRFQQRVLESVKKELGSTDDEFSVLQPRIVKVLELQFESRGYGGRGLFGRGRGPAAAILAAMPPSPVQKATADLQQVLDRKDTTTDEIKARLSDLRQARAAVREDLAKTQEDLRGLLTVRQEATLVTMGILD